MNLLAVLSFQKKDRRYSQQFIDQLAVVILKVEFFD